MQNKKERRKGFVYIIRNTVNDKVYIGQTTQSIEERFKQHLKPSTTKTKGSYKIYNDMRKYGKENFYIELLEIVDIDKLNERECYFIEYYDSYKNGYNSTRGGNSKEISTITDIELLKKLFYQNLSYKEIADKFGVNKATIVRTLHSLNLRKNKLLTKDFLENHKDLFNYQIAEMMGVNEATVTRAFQKHGITRGKGCNNYRNKQNQKQNN